MRDLRPKVFAQEWQSKYLELNEQAKYKGKLSSIFFAYAPETYAASRLRVLYIGKATAGLYNATAENKFYFGCNSSAFWTLARRLSAELAETSEPLANIAWSNLLKIGVRSGNPTQRLKDQQHALAVKTLKEEIRYFKPDLIVCVAANYFDDVLYEALDLKRGTDGFVEESHLGRKLYFRKRSGGLPPVVWLDHPQGKKKEYVERALQIAKELTQGHKSHE